MFADRFRETELHRIEIEFAGFDLGEVQNVVDDGQQRIGRARDHGSIRCCFSSTGVSSVSWSCR